MTIDLFEDRWNSLSISKETTYKGGSSYVLTGVTTNEENDFTYETEVPLYPHELGEVVSKLLVYCKEQGIHVGFPPTVGEPVSQILYVTALVRIKDPEYPLYGKEGYVSCLSIPLDTNNEYCTVVLLTTMHEVIVLRSQVEVIPPKISSTI
jgi:hypothetical protein